MLNGGKTGGGRLKAINVCYAGLCYSRDGAFVHFGKARRESFTLKRGAHHNRRHCCSLSLFHAPSDWFRLVFAFHFCDHHPSYSLCACLSFPLILFFSCSRLCSTVSLGCTPRPHPVCLSKHQISSLGETLEDSPSVYK